MNVKQKELTKKGALGIGVFLVLFLIIFPFYWIVVTSLKSPSEIIGIRKAGETVKEQAKINLSFIPQRLHTENYRDVFTQQPFVVYLKNSFIVATSTTLFCLFVGAFGAYALARLKFKGKDLILWLVLSISMFPPIAIVSPLFIILKKAGLLNSYPALIFPYTTFALPLTVYILTNFFRELPFELEEAAKVDGCTPLQAFINVIIPLATPGMFTCAILVFIFSWNEFLFALTFNTNNLMFTVPVGITMFPGLYFIPWGTIFAAAVIVTVPLVILVLIFQQRIISGLTAGAVKG